ncbi:hypothetical protein EUX98_g6772 [Antrodiella citrinella]|uniref:NADH-ubiquinone oxidoreductase 12 kDa subunit n=1 Tax=Antrodiella citrinella TaxID=2447956 RepID=A0A4S4MNF2_9APHY|nr:hypothetical protein EUX98_g6772 [Antrodiella citrinella]
MAIDEARFAELKKKKEAQDASLRESWVRAMEARIVNDNLQKCHRIEGVNHYEKCKHLADRYTEMLKDARVKGYKIIDV